MLQLTTIKDYNDGYNYILVVIDVLSKYAWVKPIKDKTARNVASAGLSTEHCHGYLYVVKPIVGKSLPAQHFRSSFAEGRYIFESLETPSLKQPWSKDSTRRYANDCTRLQSHATQ